MIVSFRDQATEDIFNGVNTKDARKACPRTLWQIEEKGSDPFNSIALR
jgi:proteic killer suppression protein